MLWFLVFDIKSNVGLLIVIRFIRAIISSKVDPHWLAWNSAIVLEKWSIIHSQIEFVYTIFGHFWIISLERKNRPIFCRKQMINFLCEHWTTWKLLRICQISLKKIFHNVSFFINKRFAVNKMFQQNASKFAIFYV